MVASSPGNTMFCLPGHGPIRLVNLHSQLHPEAIVVVGKALHEGVFSFDRNALTGLRTEALRNLSKETS